MTDQTQRQAATDPTPSPAPAPGPAFLSEQDRERIARLTARADARYGADARNQAVLERGLRFFRALVMRRDGDRWRVAKTKVIAYAVSGVAVAGFWNYWPRPSLATASKPSPEASVTRPPAATPPARPEQQEPQPSAASAEVLAAPPPALPSPRLEPDASASPAAPAGMPASGEASYDPYEREAPAQSDAAPVPAPPQERPEPVDDVPFAAPLPEPPPAPLGEPEPPVAPYAPRALPATSRASSAPRVAPSPPLVQRKPVALPGPVALVNRPAARPAALGVAGALVGLERAGEGRAAQPQFVERDVRAPQVTAAPALEREEARDAGPLSLAGAPASALASAEAVASPQERPSVSAGGALGEADALLPAVGGPTSTAELWGAPETGRAATGVLVDGGQPPAETDAAVTVAPPETLTAGAGGVLFEARRTPGSGAAASSSGPSVGTAPAETARETAVQSPYMPGTRLGARLTLGVIALAGREAPVVAALEDGSVAFGAATLGEAGRVEVALREVVRGATTTAVAGSGLDAEGYPGLKGELREEGADLLGRLVEVSLRGVSDYAQGLARSSTTTVAGGVTTVTQAGADLGWSLLGSLASALAPSHDQGQRVRFVELKAGTPFQVLFLPPR